MGFFSRQADNRTHNSYHGCHNAYKREMLFECQWDNYSPMFKEVDVSNGREPCDINNAKKPYRLVSYKNMKRIKLSN